MSDREKKKLDPAAQVLQALFENSKSPLGEGFQRYRLEQKWDEVVGTKLAGVTRPVDFHNGVMTVAVSNSSLLTELQFFREEIIEKINTFVGRLWVKKLRFIAD